ncbi:acetyl esterase [Xylaria telfairii]|nr:acetyl esterase [Xylaria telfairii]
MPLTSDLTINYTRFDPDNTAKDTKEYSDLLEKATTATPNWWDVGAPRFREMMEAGEISGLKPSRLPSAYDINLPSREPGRAIPVRVYQPANGEPSQGILLHAHGGGYSLGSHDSIDDLLNFYATACRVTAMSVGYRLAPEHPWPAGAEDCIDAATYLADHGEADHGAKLSFLAGESAGAHLMALAAFALIRSRPRHELKGLVFPYGLYTMAMGLPSMVGFERPILINEEMVRRFVDIVTPGWTVEARRRPLVSPLFEDLRALAAMTPSGKLPPALFLCGTNDPLLDDTLLMGVKWLASGSEAVIKVFPGAPHVYNGGPIDIAKESFEYEAEFLLGKM